MRLRVCSWHFETSRVPTRLPFRFGETTLREGVLGALELRVESENGPPTVGRSSDLLVPKWFEKNSELSPADDIANLESSVGAAAALATEQTDFSSVFDLWLALETSLVDQASGPGLVASFGVAQVERCLLDAVARLHGMSLLELLRSDATGFMPGAVHAELEAWRLAAALPSRPATSIDVRHTVGGLDPMRGCDVPADERVDDGPHSLEEELEHNGLRWLKIKIGAGVEPDLARLRDIEGLLSERGAADVRVTLDGNEQYHGADTLGELLARLGEERLGRRLLERLLYIEQPFPRAVSLDDAMADSLPGLSMHAPIILDEADADSAAFSRAIELGYRGISVKTCKGVFRSLLNRGLCEVRGPGLFQSAEDLTTLPVLPLQQNLALQCALGMGHAELNGHHYFDGLAHLDDGGEGALEAHPDLYRRGARGVELAIRGGALATASLQTPGFGYDEKALP